jgi:ribonucleotide reductase beta subunit family protein with ferritin-like domain
MGTSSNGNPHSSSSAAAIGVEELDAAGGDELMAFLERQPTDSRALYFEWERRQWEAGGVDLTVDAEQWGTLPPTVRTSILCLMACWQRDGTRMQELTVALADAVTTEQDQVFMTAQLADAARHSVAFDRYFAEVVSAAGASTDLGPATTALDPTLARIEEAAGEAPVASDSNALDLALFLNGVLIEGVLAPVAQASLIDILEARRALPGLRSILRASFQDHARHAAFGVGYLRRALEADAGKAASLEPEIRRSVRDVHDILSAAEISSNGFDGVSIDRDDLGSRVMDCLTHRLQDIGLELS